MSQKILVVDDDASTVKLLQTSLEQNDFDVITASNGEEGLQKLKENVPNLIILDIEMPHMNGYTFMLELKSLEDFKAIPVIVLTSHADQQPIFSIKGVKDYLIKPPKMDILMEKIKDSLFVALPWNIFFIEAKQTQQKLITHYLSKKGYNNLTFFENTEDALEKIKADKPDIIVIDVDPMEGEVGAACKNIKDNVDYDPNIILLFEGDDSFDKTKLEEFKIKAYVTKTEDYKNLIDEIASI